MKLFVSKKKYDLLNKEYLLLNDNYEELKNAYKEKCDSILDLEYKNEMQYFEKIDLENQISILNQEVELYDKTVKDLEEENEKLKKANEELAKLWNDANRKLWCNNESARQLRKLSEDILNSQKIDKSYLSSYIHDISFYVGGGVGVELKSKDK
jgi:beta-xylosidase|nr:MAG TPA: Initiation control protein YabA [Caudoviricetes sp.]